MARLRRLRGWSTAVATTALLAGCGEDKPAAGAAAGPPVSISVRYDDGIGGRVRTGALECTASGERAAGALAGPLPAKKLCAQARSLASLLTRKPAKGRACTQIYGGPETARVKGTIGGRAFDRRFKRTNGCEIADYARVAVALPARR
jgi:hypothetical protein